MEKGHSIALSSALTLGGRDVVTITHKGGDRQNWAGRGLVRDGVSATWAAGWHGALGFKAD